MVQKNILVLICILSLSYITIFLLSPKDIADYTVVDTEYWRETGNRLLLKTVYGYNDKDNILSFPKILGEWKGSDFKYPESVYAKLNAEILLSRTYVRNDNRNDSRNGSRDIVWMDIINSKTGESFHKQKICVKGSGWIIDDESIAEFDIRDGKLYANKLYISKENKKQVMIYWFMFKKFGEKDDVTMIRLSAPVRNNDTEKTLGSIKEFIEEQLFNEIYKGTKKEITTAEYLIEKWK